MSAIEEVTIGDCQLICADYLDVIGSLPMVDAVIDAPRKQVQESLL